MKSTPKKMLPEQLATLRERKGLSQADLAKRTGLQVSAISHFEKGRRSPSAANLQRLADALDVSTDYLLGRANDATPVGPAITKLIQDFAQMSANDQENLVRFASMLADKGKV